MTEQLEKEIKKIAEFWLSFEFLDKFRQIGEKYYKQIKEEENGLK